MLVDPMLIPGCFFSIRKGCLSTNMLKFLSVWPATRDRNFLNTARPKQAQMPYGCVRIRDKLAEKVSQYVSEHLLIARVEGMLNEYAQIGQIVKCEIV